MSPEIISSLAANSFYWDFTNFKLMFCELSKVTGPLTLEKKYIAALFIFNKCHCQCCEQNSSYYYCDGVKAEIQGGLVL